MGTLQNDIMLGFTLRYKDKLYQEIVNVRDFGLGSFWSNVGGFTGIFIGYSLLDLYDFLIAITKRIKVGAR